MKFARYSGWSGWLVPLDTTVRGLLQFSATRTGQDPFLILGIRPSSQISPLVLALILHSQTKQAYLCITYSTSTINCVKMCNNTSLSHFLEGVNFLEEDMTKMDLEMEPDQEDFLFEDNNLLMLDMEVDEVLDSSSSNLELPSETLPPLKLLRELEIDMDALLSVPLEHSDDPARDALEKLAKCMRRSEDTKFKLKASASPALAKANPFFTGSRVTITPELEKSRQQLWTFVRQQQQLSMTHKAPTTAAA